MAEPRFTVIKRGSVFSFSLPHGDIPPESSFGLFAGDARFLSRLSFTVDRRGLTPLTVDEGPDRLVAHFAGGALGGPGGQGELSLLARRLRAIGTGLSEKVEVLNFGKERRTLDIALEVDADFADIFEVRGFAQGPPGEARVEFSSTGTLLTRTGADGIARSTSIECAPPPHRSVALRPGARLEWKVTLEPKASWELDCIVELSGHGGGDVTVRPLAVVATTSDMFDDWLAVSSADIGALTTPTPEGQIVAAGVPWYACPFGRDSLLTSYALAPAAPAIMTDTLRVLGSRQATSDDPRLDSEPGKIPHELRFGPLAGAGLVPFAPYYGTADATPLFVIVAAERFAWRGDLAEIAALRPRLDAALDWIERWGDADGDGFVEYERRSENGLRNQGWKDSDDSVVHENGSLAAGPIALCEVQAYVYEARMRAAELYELLGDDGAAKKCRDEARRLRERFDERFWMEEHGAYALALDGDKRPVRSVTSNAGHCLWTGIALPERAAFLGPRLLEEDLFTGWGLRTLSERSPAYNPASYHNGSVWPHDSALIAAGLRRYGLVDECLRLAGALTDAAFEDPGLRLPELLCGFQRAAGVSYVPYPSSCRPQAWAAAVPWLLLRALLGLEASHGRLTVRAPVLPEGVDRLRLEELEVGGRSVTLDFERRDGRVHCEASGSPETTTIVG